MGARAWLREPLLHFALLGGLIFAAYAALTPADELGVIRVSADTRARLLAAQRTRLDREPKAEELEAAIEAWIEDELLYREALALGLERGDPIIRRRLLQKMRFVLEAGAEPEAPSDEQLKAWLELHPELSLGEPRVALRHVFFAAGPSQEPAQIGAALRALRAGAAPEGLGEAFVLGASIGPKTEAELDRSFGPGFGAAVIELPLTGWHPLSSSYGVHLVQIEGRVPAGVASFESLRGRAAAAWRREAQARGSEAALEQLRGRYRVEREGP